jgi:hypothetical protein
MFTIVDFSGRVGLCATRYPNSEYRAAMRPARH